MVKFGKNKLKALNKIAKAKQNNPVSSTNKVLKKKQNADKKLTFQKEILKDAVTESSPLIKKVKASEVLLDQLSKRAVKKKPKVQKAENKKKLRPVEKQKKRQRTQINDTKILLSLMKKK